MTAGEKKAQSTKTKEAELLKHGARIELHWLEQAADKKVQRLTKDCEAKERQRENVAAEEKEETLAKQRAAMDMLRRKQTANKNREEGETVEKADGRRESREAGKNTGGREATSSQTVGR